MPTGYRGAELLSVDRPISGSTSKPVPSIELGRQWASRLRGRRGRSHLPPRYQHRKHPAFAGGLGTVQTAGRGYRGAQWVHPGRAAPVAVRRIRRCGPASPRGRRHPCRNRVGSDWIGRLELTADTPGRLLRERGLSCQGDRASSPYRPRKSDSLAGSRHPL